jgi:hypothetical protein
MIRFHLHTQIKNAFDNGNYSNEVGININQLLNIVNQNGMNINLGAIKDVCSKMCDDGMIYSTIDDDHYLTT